MVSDRETKIDLHPLPAMPQIVMQLLQNANLVDQLPPNRRQRDASKREDAQAPRQTANKRHGRQATDSSKRKVQDKRGQNSSGVKS